MKIITIILCSFLLACSRDTSNKPVNPNPSSATYGFFRKLEPKVITQLVAQQSEKSVANALFDGNPSITMATPRSGHKTVEVSAGIYMLIGGEMGSNISNPLTTPSVIDLFDINNETFTRLGIATNVSRHWKSDGSQSFALVKLPNHNTLMIGGADSVTDTVEVFDYDLKVISYYTNVFPIGQEVNNVGHAFYTGNNKVILVGCWYTKNGVVTSRDNAVLDLITMKANFILTPKFLCRNTAVLLSDNSVIFAGGEDINYTSSNDIYKINPDQSTVKLGSMQVPRQDYAMTALPDGNIGIYGGVNRPSAAGVVLYHKSVEILDPNTGITTYSTNLLDARLDTVAVVLQNGFVLNAGGCNGQGNLVDDEFVHNHLSGISGTTGKLNIPRRFYSTVPLNNGRILISGGDNTGTAYNTAEIYDPAMKLIISYDTESIVAVNTVIHFTASENCTWSVVAVDGKSATGSISPTGVYTAPATATKVKIVANGSNSALVLIDVI